MERRGFLGGIGAALAALVGGKPPAEQGRGVETAALGETAAPATGPVGHVFKEDVRGLAAQAGYADENGARIFVLGVVTRDARAGELAYVQVSGPAAVRLAESVVPPPRMLYKPMKPMKRAR